jgi:hypothetical protein
VSDLAGDAWFQRRKKLHEQARPCSCDPRLPAMDRCGRGWVRCNEGLRALLTERGERRAK